ncbi:hypothetical protein BFP72_13265 [Reichenbachiella sp. 5M10]|uniref:4'-phosphopantetheinyl transferase family protein n=1 Tax=Reichenbachiella sp. 5M10 TaxID=1889772 RepID=UPI000C160842|nr:4'-phosphopantetheinyl transferase superfamily protein [Reichenbachiella sp. 5M10]PIB36293.1 hypothetical protein BFP72_13265 [Reichenbachiella sp. 5M10]
MIHLHLPEGLYSCFSDLSHSSEVLFETEKNIATAYEPKRLMEFCSGRYCAHLSLKKLGVDAPILKTEEGAPLWPKGITGSISHSTQTAGSIVASTDRIQSIGLDIETMGRISPDMWSILFTPNEINMLMHSKPAEIDFLSTLLFSMKESFYKMQFPISQHFMDFQDCEVTYSNEKCHIQPHVSLSAPLNNPAQYDIKFLRLETEIITYIILHRPDSSFRHDKPKHQVYNHPRKPYRHERQ